MLWRLAPPEQRTLHATSARPPRDELLLPAEGAARVWAEMVRANREQVELFREMDPAQDRDFYAPVAQLFRADPRREGDPTLEALVRLGRPGEQWLDIGAGGGRFALPLALRVEKVIALDPSAGMLDQLQGGLQEHGIANVHVVQGRWPPPDSELHRYTCDVALISHVGYDVEEIGPFLDAMERAARRLCVAVLLERPPTTQLDRLWPTVHGVERARLPSLPEFLSLLLARGSLFEVALVERSPQSYATPDEALNFARRQFWVQPEGEKHQRLERVIREQLRESGGRFALSWDPARVGIVTWDGGAHAS